MKKFLKDDRGSFTVEATFIFPLYLMFLVAMLLFIIAFFQIGVVQYAASSAAESAAYNWNNKEKDFNTGEFSKDEYVGGPEQGTLSLYWRAGETLNALFSIASFDGLFSGTISTKEQLAEKGAYQKTNVEVKVDYSPKVLYNEVNATAEMPLYVPQIVKDALGTGAIKADAKSVYVDTPEMVRTINFGKYIFTAASQGGGVSEAIDNVKKWIK